MRHKITPRSFKPRGATGPASRVNFDTLDGLPGYDRVSPAGTHRADRPAAPGFTMAALLKL